MNLRVVPYQTGLCLFTAWFKHNLAKIEVFIHPWPIVLSLSFPFTANVTFTQVLRPKPSTLHKPCFTPTAYPPVGHVDLPSKVILLCTFLHADSASLFSAIVTASYPTFLFLLSPLVSSQRAVRESLFRMSKRSCSPPAGIPAVSYHTQDQINLLPCPLRPL